MHTIVRHVDTSFRHKADACWPLIQSSELVLGSSQCSLLPLSPQVEVASSDTIQELVSHANRARSTGSTGVNEDSSRSHSIMQVCPQVTQYLLHPMSCPARKAQYVNTAHA